MIKNTIGAILFIVAWSVFFGYVFIDHTDIEAAWACLRGRPVMYKMTLRSDSVIQIIGDNKDVFVVDNTFDALEVLIGEKLLENTYTK